MKLLMWVVGALVALVFVGWLGFQVRPAGFAPLRYPGRQPETTTIPAGLPAPVERFLRATYGGDRIPVLSTVVLSGRAAMRPAGPLYLPARYRFVHNVGRDYRHYFEATWFGLPILTVDEGYVDGVSFFESPLVGSQADHPKLRQGANLALWTEAMLFPAALVLDPRVSWEAVDDHTAVLRVPFEDGRESVVVRFDPDTGLVTTMEAMRYRSTSDAKKTLWIPSSDEYAVLGGATMAVACSATWFDQKSAWATFRVEEVVLNADLGDYLHARGE